MITTGLISECGARENVQLDWTGSPGSRDGSEQDKRSLETQLRVERWGML